MRANLKGTRTAHIKRLTREKVSRMGVAIEEIICLAIPQKNSRHAGGARQKKIIGEGVNPQR